jgi:UDP-N-acetylglucosamine--N-acetylmuramyl-(pentapeptide) pyrophosphoryl-undecaprenol N-acetylglucosamine transferase
MPIGKIVLTCGGTGGHVYPAIALAQELSEYQSVFLGTTDRIDGDMVRRHGMPFYGIASSGVAMWTVVSGVFRALVHLRRIRPIVVICTGGMITFPVAIAAKLRGIPIVVLEQNMIAGRTNRLVAMMAKLVITAFPGTMGLEKAVPLGNPVRKKFLHDRWMDQLEPILKDQVAVILVFGGSQGARALNQTVLDSIPKFAANRWFLVHIMGDKDYRAMGYSGSIQSIVTPSEKVVGVMVPYSESMDMLYRYASVVVCRAGATSIAELLEFHSRAVLVPYPHAKDDHQTANAAVMERAGRSVTLKEAQLKPATLIASIESALHLQLPSPTVGARERVATMIRKLL